MCGLFSARVPITSPTPKPISRQRGARAAENRLQVQRPSRPSPRRRPATARLSARSCAGVMRPARKHETANVALCLHGAQSVPDIMDRCVKSCRGARRYQVFELLSAAAILFASGCAGLPRHVGKAAARRHCRTPPTTTLGRIVASEEAGKNLSGIRLLTSGEEALADLIALADHAERTLDIQYYIIHAGSNQRGCCCTMCAWRRTAACGCASWSTI